jgi:hypothetical protein
MISCLTELGRIGLTAVGKTRDDAWKLYRSVEQILLQEAQDARCEIELDG